MAKTQTNNFTLSLNFQSNGSIPKWIEVVPVADFEGHDGRAFSNPDPSLVIQETINSGRDIPIDIEHSTEIKAPKGEPAPAYGWIEASLKSFDIRDGSIFARVKWTRQGKTILTNKEYRYYSPAVVVDTTGRVLSLRSVGLVNRPNLKLTALNHEEKPNMTLATKIKSALSLNSGATVDDAVAAISQLKADKQVALNSAQAPDATKFIPKATYELALNRAANAETKLKDQTDKALKEAISTAVDGAVAAGKIAPANSQYYMTACNSEGGLEAFNEFVKTAPAIVKDSGLDDKTAGKSTALNAEEAAVAKQLGISPEDFAKQKGEKA